MEGDTKTTAAQSCKSQFDSRVEAFDRANPNRHFVLRRDVARQDARMVHEFSGQNF